MNNYTLQPMQQKDIKEYTLSRDDNMLQPVPETVKAPTPVLTEAVTFPNEAEFRQARIPETSSFSDITTATENDRRWSGNIPPRSHRSTGRSSIE